MSYPTKWIKRRFYTIGLVVLLVLWYGVQLLVASQIGVENAEKWFYFTSEIGTGWLFSPISHDMNNPSHLFVNTMVLFIGGSLIEPYLPTRNYLSTFFTVSVISIIVPAFGALLFLDPPWLVAGASGGAYGLWVFASVYRSDAILEYREVFQVNEWLEIRYIIELFIILLGMSLIILVPLFDILSQNRTSIFSHVTGMLVGLIIGVRSLMR